jgi:ABC-2 type transport system permease protein/capsular polysaccharide transport system permease protein
VLIRVIRGQIPFIPFIPVSTVNTSTQEISLRESFKIQRRVIGALLMREILDRWGRHNIGFLWLFGEPMVFTLAVMTLWSLTGMAHSGSISPVGFAITGYSSILLWRNMPARLIKAVEANHTLMHHRNIKVADVFITRLLLETMGATMSLTILTLFFNYFGLLDLPEDPLKVVIAWLLLTWIGVGLALTIGSLSERSEIVHIIWHPTAYIMIPLAGACFTVNSLPRNFQTVVLYIPMVNGVEMLREGFFGDTFHAHYSIPYMVGWCLVLTFIGLGQMTIISRKIVA